MKMVKTKHKEFADDIPIMLCQHSSWIMGSKINKEGRIQIPLSSPIMVDTLAQNPR